jgi:hypothetical protein
MPKIKPAKAIFIAVCVAIIAAIAWYTLKPKNTQPQYITAEVTVEILKILYLQQVTWKQPKW